jgi:Ca-activated chloride channel family protein
MTGIELFHFLRPLWLIAVPAIIVIWWLVRRRDTHGRPSGNLVAPHLRDALTMNRADNSAIWPVDYVAVAALCAVLAAAGPTWSKQPSPWFSETAPLVVAIEVSDSMRSNDLQPTRLDRARFKILDLISARTGSRTAIIAYAGSAHIVIPPTSDIDVIKPLLESMDPAVMPVPGADATAALAVAEKLLGDELSIGTVLFVNDGFEPADVSGVAEFSAQPGAPALVALVVGTDDGGVALMPDGSPVVAEGGGRIDTSIDPAVLRRMSRESGMDIQRAGPGKDDVYQLVRAIESSLRQADDPNAQWKDQGWWLLWPAALLTLLWFRRGVTMQW